MFWKGSDVERSQNLWRRWMLACNMPRPGGKPLRPMYCFCSGGFFEGLKVSEASEKQFIDALTKEGDQAGLLVDGRRLVSLRSWPETGTWEPDAQRFPHGIKAVSDYVHAKNAKLIVWFEPERVTGGSGLAKNHPEWLLGGDAVEPGQSGGPQVAYRPRRSASHASRASISIARISIWLRLDYWRKNDAPDRQGITENLHVQGYLGLLGRTCCGVIRAC